MAPWVIAVALVVCGCSRPWTTPEAYEAEQARVRVRADQQSADGALESVRACERLGGTDCKRYADGRAAEGLAAPPEPESEPASVQSDVVPDPTQSAPTQGSDYTLDVPALRAPRRGSSGPKCTKGCPCGNSCISCSKTCRK